MNDPLRDALAEALTALREAIDYARLAKTGTRRSRWEAAYSAGLAALEDYDDHDWSSTGSPTYCRGCHITFPAWERAQRLAQEEVAATPTAASGYLPGARYGTGGNVLAGSEPAGLDERLWRAFMEYGVHQDGCHLEAVCWCGYSEALTYATSLAALAATASPTATGEATE